MGIFEETVTQVGATTIGLLDEQPDLVKRATIEYLFKGGNLTHKIINNLYNGLSGGLERAYQYGQDYYSEGLPGGTYTVYAPSLDLIKDYLVEKHATTADQVSLKSVSLTRDVDPNFFNYLALNYQYDLFTEKFKQIPADLQTLVDAELVNANNYTAVFPADKYTTLTDTVPPDSTTQTTDTDGNTVTTALTYNTEESLSYKFIHRTDTRLSDYELDALTSGGSAVTIQGNITTYLYITHYQSLRIKVAPTKTVTVTNPEGQVLKETVTNLAVFSLNDTHLEEVTHTYNKAVSYTPDYNVDAYYYLIVYALKNTEGVFEGTHLYFPSLQGYEPLGFPLKRAVVDGNFFPMVTLRKDNVDLFDESRVGDDTYETSIKLVDKIGINLLDIVEAINESPDIEDVDHAYLICGINLRTENEASINYLCNFFAKNAFLDNEGNTTPTENEIITDDLDLLDGEDLFQDYTDSSLTIRDKTYDYLDQRKMIAMGGGGYSGALYWQKITLKYFQGKIGKKGFADKVLDGTNETMTLRQQIDTNTYREIVIEGLEHHHNVYEYHKVVTRISDIVKPKEDVENDNFVIPVQYQTWKDLPVIMREKCSEDMLQLVLYSIEITKLEWYQTTFFRFALTVVAIIVFISTGQGAEFIAALSAGVEATLIYLANMYLSSIILTYAFELLVEAIGIDAAIILAVILTIASIAESFDFDLTNLNADQLLTASLGLQKAITNTLKEMMLDLQAEAEAFFDILEDELEALEKAQDSLSINELVDPLIFTNIYPEIKINESPADFYERTIHQGNVGANAFKYIENFVDAKLTLPKPEYS